MKKRSKYLVTTVHVNDLTENMTIIAYTGFSDKYKKVDEKTCMFMHNNFKGAKALVFRDGKKLELAVEQIKPGDTVNQIFSFPSTKKKLTQTSPKLIAALKKTGIISFKIKKMRQLPGGFSSDLQDAIAQVNFMMQTPSKSQDRIKEGIYHANLMVEKIKESQQQRKEGADIVETLMDNARMGKLNISDIEYYVENIIKHASSEAMMAIVNLKSSDHTYTHCIDVGVLFKKLYYEAVERENRKAAFDTPNQALLGGFLHDFGKSQLPKELLDSNARFETGSKEMEMMRTHPYHGAKLLNGMDMPDSIVNMSLCHHVKMDESLNSSYPEKLSYGDSHFEAKFLSIVDIYQALVGKRNYKRSWTPPQAIRYLSALAGIEYDEHIWERFLSLMGEYPIGSLVVLNDDSLGFVMNVPEEGEDLLRPQVALVRNSFGEDLEKHTLLDLQEEKDMSIKNDLDAMDVFDNQSINRFAELKIVA